MLLDVAPRRGAANSKIIYGNTTARATQVTGSDKFLTTGGLPGTGVTAPWQIEPLVLIVNGWLQDRRRERQLHILQEGTSGDTNTGMHAEETGTFQVKIIMEAKLRQDIPFPQAAAMEAWRRR
ncbi:hypothetical protein Vretimale_20040 [Volvox reticuliferus]|uniref:Uncharacterized protein n=1 Tax=Volvox reticuliferus TaxID=1737510 RepID=A0A8J4FUI0_9CHLO|nr:hypothetical protein Vretifemale_13384 [Volvox reticuliferus]GIM17492.1 hypothetical protein Vretimale_20040 [Volvox reticuliferus]